MSFDVYLDPLTGDLPEVSSFVRDEELTVQRARVRLQTFYGEWILDQFVGIPYIVWREQKPPDVDAIVSVLRAEIAGTPGVIRVTAIEGSFDIATRKVTVSGEAVIEGPEQVDELSTAFAATFGANVTPIAVFQSVAGVVN